MSLEHFGITHLSPTAINLWCSCPSLFLLERILKRGTKVGAAAHRGSAAEAGVAKALVEGASLEDAQAHALTQYRTLTALSGDPNRDKEGAAVPAIVATALPVLADLGSVETYQRKVEWYDPVMLPVPIIGFLDFEMQERIVDLKTQLRLSSSISNGHARQVALYSRCTNKPASLLYATPQKAALYELDDVARHFDALVKIGQSLVRFLSLSKDGEELARLLSPDLDSYFFNDIAARSAAREVWGW